MDRSNDQREEVDTSNSPPRLSHLLSEVDRYKAKARNLEIAKVEAELLAQDWEQKYKQMAQELRKLQEEYEKKASEHWALENGYQDQSRELEILQLMLQNSIPLADWLDPPPKLRTALEIGQQNEIEMLQNEKARLREEIERLKGNKVVVG